MSIYQVGSSAMPSIVGYSALGLGVLSAGSLLVGGQPVINVPGNEVVDFAASILAFLGGGAILKSRDPTAAWMGAGVIVMALTYAGMQINTSQAGNMLDAAKSAAVQGAQAAASATTAGKSHWDNTRKLTALELQWCDGDDDGDGTPNRHESKQAVLNCSTGEMPL